MADPFLQQQQLQQEQQHGQGGHHYGSHFVYHEQQRPATGAPGDWAIPHSAEGQPLLYGYAYNPGLKDAALYDRQNFVRKVYGILSVQLALTCAIAMPIATSDVIWIEQNRWLLYFAYAGLIAMLCGMVCFQQGMREFPSNYAFLGLMTGCMAILVGFASASYSWQSVALAVGVTAVMFLALTLYAFVTGRDFTGYGPYLFVTLCGLTFFTLIVIILGVIGMDVSWLIIFLDVIGVLLFSFYIIYDTQLILGGKHEHGFTIDDYAFAALSLYLDIINLFLHILSLFGDRN